MKPQRHTINKQVIEIHMPKTANVHDAQKRVSKLYQQTLVPIIDRLLSDRYGDDEKIHHQINELTIDLGEVAIEDIASVFTEKFARAIATHTLPKVPEEKENAQNNDQPATPLKILAYYLANGILPWWSGETTKAYLLAQIDELLETPGSPFKTVLAQLPFNKVYLDRFLNIATEEQLIRALQLLTDISLKNLSETKKKLLNFVRNSPGSSSQAYTDFRIAKTFWASVFHQAKAAKNYPDLEKHSARQVFREMEISLQASETAIRNTGQWPFSIPGWTNTGKEKADTDLSVIQSLANKLKAHYPENSVWQEFFRHLAEILPSLQYADPRLLKELKQQLKNLELVQEKSMQAWNKQKHTKEKQPVPNDRLRAITEINLHPVAKHLHLLEATVKQAQHGRTQHSIKTLTSDFEDTDVIPVQNAGLVILWPFLQRFFENLGLMDNKEFRDEALRNKAACALQYLIDEDESALFEGQLLLNKVLCAIPLEAPLEPLTLLADEKEAAESLLQAAISRGPYWENLSVSGFRNTYLQREGLLRTRDDHWLLQVKKETYDITLEKLPWSFTVVKLPWMPRPLMVEWG